MSGVDTIRGITYQHACAIAASLDVLEDRELSAIRIEMSHDVVDYDILERSGRLRLIAQVKTRIEPYAFSPADIASVLIRWCGETHPHADAYHFLSDGPLSAEAVRLIGRPLNALRDGGDRALVEPELSQAGIATVSTDFLRRVRIRTRNGDVSSVLDSAELHLLRLAEMCGPIRSDETAGRIDRLFRIISVRGGSRNAEERVFERVELANILLLDLDAIDRGHRWTPELAEQHRQSFISSPPVSTILLDAAPAQHEHPALTLPRLTLRQDSGIRSFALDTLPSTFDRCSIEGPAGAGKSTALDLIAYHAARAGLIPIPVAPSRYREGDLMRLIRAALESGAGRILAPGAVDAALNTERCILLVDGFTERPRDEVNQLRGDLIELLATRPRLQAVVTGRYSESFRLPDVPILALEGLDAEQRRSLAGSILPSGLNHPSLVDDVEHALGTAAANPLLFTMALSLRQSGYSVSSRASLYRGMVEGLFARHPQDEPEELLNEVMARMARALVENGRFQLQRSRWPRILSEMLDRIECPGDGWQIYEAALRVGVIRTPSFSRDVAFLHDSFRDYFASLSYRPNSVGPPTEITVDHELSVELFCEENGVSPDLALQVAAQNPLLLCHVARYRPPRAEGEDVELALRLLSILVERHTGSLIEEVCKRTLGLRVSWTSTHSWLILTHDGVPTAVRNPAELAIVGSGPFFWAVKGNLGPISLACLVWRRLIEDALNATARQAPRWVRTVGYTPDVLVHRVDEAARARECALVDTARRVFPSISERLLAYIGPTSLRAYIDTDTIRGDGEHLMTYRYHDEDHAIDLTTNRPNGAIGYNWGQTSAENYLSEHPIRKAANRLLKAFDKLVAGSEQP